MKSITLRVTHRVFRREKCLHATYRGQSGYRTTDFLRYAGQPVPEGRYRVRYTVDAKGPLYLLGDDYVTNGMQGAGYAVCFLTWLQVPSYTRLSRKVLPW